VKLSTLRLHFPQPTGSLYIVSDSHLDQQSAPAAEFVNMLDALPDAQVVLCLGDLFKVWLAHPRFWSRLNREVMHGFWRLKECGATNVFVVGNREVLVPHDHRPERQELPFEHIAHDELEVKWGEWKLGFLHGDTVNSRDRQYLRWRWICRSSLFRGFFRALPGPLAMKIAHRVEDSLNATNQEFKISFPEAEVRLFAARVLREFDAYFLGHFHRDDLIQVDGLDGFLRVVPDWLGSRRVLRLSPQGKLETLVFHNEKLESADSEAMVSPESLSVGSASPTN
jgi:UDP-2,3-diacylglucosamine pyrophosphatase LpxH